MIRDDQIIQDQPDMQSSRSSKAQDLPFLHGMCLQLLWVRSYWSPLGNSDVPKYVPILVSKKTQLLYIGIRQDKNLVRVSSVLPNFVYEYHNKTVLITYILYKICFIPLSRSQLNSIPYTSSVGCLISFQKVQQFNNKILIRDGVKSLDF